MPKPILYIAERADFSKDVFAKLEEKFEILNPESALDIKETLEQVDVFWFRLAHQINGEVLTQNSRCKYLVSPVTGIDHIDEKLCEELGVNIVCLRGEYDFLNMVRATAELTLALTLSLLRHIPDAVNHTRKKLWQRDQFRGRELFEKKVGIVGYGRLGKICGNYFHAMGCKVGYYDVEKKEHEDWVYKYDSLEALLKDSDVLTIHIPYNESTRGMFDSACFAKMKASSVLINSSRGGIIEEEALLTALNSGKISGAALDVLNGEPNIKENCLIAYSIENSNLIITPHIGGNTFESFEKTEHFIADKLIREYAT